MKTVIKLIQKYCPVIRKKHHFTVALPL